MKKNPIESIVASCLTVDRCAWEAYQRLARGSEHPELSEFWRHMAEEESTHLSYWKSLAGLAEEQSLPQVFENPAAVQLELEQLADKALALLEQPIESLDLKDSFVLAYRLEFFMLHPAFERLFHTLRTSAGGTNPEDDYAEHINRFVSMLSHYGHLTSEFQLISETLGRLWQENRKLAQQAMKDVLTGLLNRRGFFQVAEQLLYVARRGDERVSLLMIDIDDFKSLNDTLGHEHGDSVLRGVAQRLSQAIRVSDVAGRYGGEEFVVLLFAVDPEAVEGAAERVRSAVEQEAISGSPVTVSVGAADCLVPTEVDSDLRQLIRNADRRMYAAKHEGKNRSMTRD